MDVRLNPQPNYHYIHICKNLLNSKNKKLCMLLDE